MITAPLLIGLGMAVFVLIIAVLLVGGIDGFRTEPRLRATDEVSPDQ
jgi:hypothetical protein